jgi:uncharacterized coiled-coil protein SlyX
VLYRNKDKTKMNMNELNAKVEAVAAVVDKQNSVLEALQATLSRLNAVAQAQPAQTYTAPPQPQGQMVAPAFQVVQLSPQQQAAVQTDPRLLQQYLPANGVAFAPTPSNPNGILAHSAAGFQGALVDAKTRLYIQGNVPEQVAAAIALVEAKQSLQAFSSAGNFVMPDLPKGFKWEWYHVVGVGLLCALVGVGGYWAYGRWFKDKTAG